MTLKHPADCNCHICEPRTDWLGDDQADTPDHFEGNLAANIAGGYEPRSTTSGARQRPVRRPAVGLVRQMLKSWLLCGGRHKGDGFTTHAKGWVWCTRCETHIHVR